MVKHLDVQQVCLNGHQITFTYSDESTRRKFCEDCGAPTIHKCPSCGGNIDGLEHDSMDLFATPPLVPDHCNKCGSAFPWTKKRKVVQSITSSTKPIVTLELLAKRFDGVVKQLRRRHEDRETLDVKDEYDVQDLLHALLHIYFDDIRPEEWSPSYGGSCKRMDFLLKEEKMVIETKMTRKGLNASKLGDELKIDIANYEAHPDCKTLFCLVYDPEGRIANPKGIEKDLSIERDGFRTVVRIVR